MQHSANAITFDYPADETAVPAAEYTEPLPDTNVGPQIQSEQTGPQTNSEEVAVEQLNDTSATGLLIEPYPTPAPADNSNLPACDWILNRRITPPSDFVLTEYRWDNMINWKANNPGGTQVGSSRPNDYDIIIRKPHVHAWSGQLYYTEHRLDKVPNPEVTIRNINTRHLPLILKMRTGVYCNGGRWDYNLNVPNRATSDWAEVTYTLHMQEYAPKLNLIEERRDDQNVYLGWDEPSSYDGHEITFLGLDLYFFPYPGNNISVDPRLDILVNANTDHAVISRQMIYNFWLENDRWLTNLTDFAGHFYLESSWRTHEGRLISRREELYYSDHWAN